MGGYALDPEFIRSELATTHAKAPAFLRDAITARWLTRSVIDLVATIATLEIVRYPYTSGREQRMAFLHRVIF